MQFLLCEDGSFINLGNVLRFSVEHDSEDRRWRVVAELHNAVRQGTPSRHTQSIVVHIFAESVGSREEAVSHLRDLADGWNSGRESRGAGEFYLTNIRPDPEG